MAVYLLHFERKIGRAQSNAQREANGLPPRANTYRAHAQHYLGSTTHLSQRLAQHFNGNGAKLVACAARRGIPFALARVWEVHDGPCTNLTGNGECVECRRFEYQLKRRKNHPRLCPICRGEAEFEEWIPF